eukprot:COSAG02_NODE_1328_length_13219_cov_45.612652_15_plen_137_part_00
MHTSSVPSASPLLLRPPLRSPTSTAAPLLSPIKQLIEPIRAFAATFANCLPKFCTDAQIPIFLAGDVEERCCITSIARATCTTDSMNVVVDLGWQVKVDHVGYVGYIQTACRYVSPNEHPNLSVSELPQSSLSNCL